MAKCPDCGSDVATWLNGSGVTVSCDRVQMKNGRREYSPCGWGATMTRDELVAFAVARAKKADDRETVRYELRLDETRREPGEWAIARVGFSGAQLLTNLGRWANANRAEAEAALGAYLKNQELVA